jgi:hypothetical protein
MLLLSLLLGHPDTPMLRWTTSAFADLETVLILGAAGWEEKIGEIEIGEGHVGGRQAPRQVEGNTGGNLRCFLPPSFAPL